MLLGGIKTRLTDFIQRFKDVKGRPEKPEDQLIVCLPASGDLKELSADISLTMDELSYGRNTSVQNVGSVKSPCDLTKRQLLYPLPTSDVASICGILSEVSNLKKHPYKFDFDRQDPGKIHVSYIGDNKGALSLNTEIDGSGSLECGFNIQGPTCRTPEWIPVGQGNRLISSSGQGSTTLSIRRRVMDRYGIKLMAALKPGRLIRANLQNRTRGLTGMNHNISLEIVSNSSNKDDKSTLSEAPEEFNHLNIAKNDLESTTATHNRIIDLIFDMSSNLQSTPSWSYKTVSNGVNRLVLSRENLKIVGNRSIQFVHRRLNDSREGYVNLFRWQEQLGRVFEHSRGVLKISTQTIANFLFPRSPWIEQRLNLAYILDYVELRANMAMSTYAKVEDRHTADPAYKMNFGGGMAADADYPESDNKNVDMYGKLTMRFQYWNPLHICLQKAWVKDFGGRISSLDACISAELQLPIGDAKCNVGFASPLESFSSDRIRLGMSFQSSII